MKLDANYLKLSSRRNPTMTKWGVVSLFLVLDSAIFFMALIGGFAIVNFGSLAGISSLMISAYSRIIITAWFLFLVSLNLFSVYRPSNVFSLRRVLAGVAIFWLAVTGLSFMYPSLRFSLALSFWSSLLMGVALSLSRYGIRRFW